MNLFRALLYVCQWTASQIPTILVLAENSFSGLDPQSHKENYEDMENYLPELKNADKKLNTLDVTTKLFIGGQREHSQVIFKMSFLFPLVVTNWVTLT